MVMHVCMAVLHLLGLVLGLVAAPKRAKEREMMSANNMATARLLAEQEGRLSSPGAGTGTTPPPLRT